MIGSASHDAVRGALILPGVMLLSSAGGVIDVPGPALIRIAGVTLPIFSAIAAVIGVILGRLLAPAPGSR